MRPGRARFFFFPFHVVCCQFETKINLNDLATKVNNVIEFGITLF